MMTLLKPFIISIVTLSTISYALGIDQTHEAETKRSRLGESLINKQSPPLPIPQEPLTIDSRKLFAPLSHWLAFLLQDDGILAPLAYTNRWGRGLVTLARQRRANKGEVQKFLFENLQTPMSDRSPVVQDLVLGRSSLTYSDLIDSTFGLGRRSIFDRLAQVLSTQEISRSRDLALRFFRQFLPLLVVADKPPQNIEALNDILINLNMNVWLSFLNIRFNRAKQPVVLKDQDTHQTLRRVHSLLRQIETPLYQGNLSILKKSEEIKSHFVNAYQNILLQLARDGGFKNTIVEDLTSLERVCNYYFQVCDFQQRMQEKYPENNILTQLILNIRQCAGFTLNAIFIMPGMRDVLDDEDLIKKLLQFQHFFEGGYVLSRLIMIRPELARSMAYLSGVYRFMASTPPDQPFPKTAKYLHGICVKEMKKGEIYGCLDPRLGAMGDLFRKVAREPFTPVMQEKFDYLLTSYQGIPISQDSDASYVTRIATKGMMLPATAEGYRVISMADNFFAELIYRYHKNHPGDPLPEWFEFFAQRVSSQTLYTIFRDVVVSTQKSNAMLQRMMDSLINILKDKPADQVQPYLFSPEGEPLTFFCQTQNMLKFILSLNINGQALYNVNMTDHRGNTLLHAICNRPKAMRYATSLIKYLVGPKHNMDASVPNQRGDTPRDLVRDGFDSTKARPTLGSKRAEIIKLFEGSIEKRGKGPKKKRKAQKRGE